MSNNNVRTFVKHLLKDVHCCCCLLLLFFSLSSLFSFQYTYRRQRHGDDGGGVRLTSPFSYCCFWDSLLLLLPVVACCSSSSSDSNRRMSMKATMTTNDRSLSIRCKKVIRHRNNKDLKKHGTLLSNYTGEGQDARREIFQKISFEQCSKTLRAQNNRVQKDDFY